MTILRAIRPNSSASLEQVADDGHYSHECKDGEGLRCFAICLVVERQVSFHA